MTPGEPAPADGGAHTYRGRVRIAYAPRDDQAPDPGEVVWCWVAFEEDDAIGKDRPVVIVGETADGRLAALMLSSRDHAGDRRWRRVGAGPWDGDGRESWARIDRVLAVEASAVRREGAVLARPVFDALAAALGGSRSARMPRLRRFVARVFR